MRSGIATTMRRTPSSVASLRSAYACSSGGRYVASAPSSSSSSSSIASPSRRQISTSSTCLLVRPSWPRFAADQRGVERSPTASSSTEQMPPTLVRPPRRRNSRSGQSQPQTAEAEGDQVARSRARSKGKVTAGGQQEATAAGEADDANVHASPSTSGQRVAPPSSSDQSSLSQESKADATASSKSISERIKGLWENIKYLFRFYYNGVKQIWKDRTRVNAMRKEIAEREASGKEGVRWMEKSVIELHQADVRKLPLFLAILIILEEVLPLVVIYAPSLLPSTCILPSQSLKMRSEEERRRGMAVQRLASDLSVRNVVDHIVTLTCTDPAQSLQNSELPVTDVERPQKLSELNGKALRDVANVFGIRSWGPVSLVSSRIEAHLRFLHEDDQLLLRVWQARHSNDEDDMNRWMAICKSPWLWRACSRRGLRASAADEAVMERNLEAYLHTVSQLDEGISLQRALVPLALYDGTQRLLNQLQGQASEEQSKGLRKRTAEVVESVVKEEKRKEGVE